MRQQFQPDFVITIGGRDVTNWTEHWHLQDIEDGISSLEVTLGNEDYMFSGAFDDGDKMFQSLNRFKPC